ncbi:hypothetical protein [Azospirillum argentinense]|uniref:hypothetical protein n=1 Tax=Azospirillum argentinense TaxID=2970906 RepID=UPI0032E01A30
MGERQEDEQEPEKAELLLPMRISFTCPSCRAAGEADVKEVDDSGLHRVPDEDRFIHCEECGLFLDIGWAGWGYHDAHAAGAAQGEV